jgi:hypothetical protein
VETGRRELLAFCSRDLLSENAVYPLLILPLMLFPFLISYFHYFLTKQKLRQKELGKF